MVDVFASSELVTSKMNELDKIEIVSYLKPAGSKRFADDTVAVPFSRPFCLCRCMALMNEFL